MKNVGDSKQVEYLQVPEAAVTGLPPAPFFCALLVAREKILRFFLSAWCEQSQFTMYVLFVRL